MAQQNTTKKRSMRHTPQNKIRSIDRNLLQCEMALLVLIELIEVGSGSDEASSALRDKKTSLEAHIMHLKESKGFWSKAKA